MDAPARARYRARVIRAGVGLSTEPDTEDAVHRAVAEAASGLRGRAADWCVLFASGEHALRDRTLLDAVASASGTPYIAGCSGAGVLGAGRELEGRSAVGLLLVASDALRATPFLFADPGDDQGIAVGRRVGERFAASRGSDDLLLVWPDPLRVRPDRLLEGIDAALPGIPVAGGAAATHRPELETRQWSGVEAVTGGISGLRLGGRFGHRVVSTQGCRPIGAPLRVTRSHDNLVLELDGRSPIEVIESLVPEGMLDDPARALESLSIGLLPDRDVPQRSSTDFLVRNIVAMDPDTGLLAVAATIEEGESIVLTLREPHAARADLSRVLAPLAVEHEAAPFAFGFYFDCMARGRSFYGTEGVDAALLAKALPGVPLLGFFCAAEMAPLSGANRFLTYSGVLVLVSA